MKTLLLFIALTTYSCFVKADCDEYDTRVIWPSGKVITNNSFIVINSSDEKLLEKATGKNFFFLKQVNGKEKIFLTVIQLHAGLNLTQIILKPQSPLTEEKEYGLFYSNTDQKQTKSQKTNFKHLPLQSWVVKRSADNILPVWINQPKIIRKYYQPGGCGPDIKVIFSLQGLDRSPMLVKAIVKNNSTGRMDTCYLKLRFGELELGHHMCWGEFRFDDESGSGKDKYEVTFWLIDESGNTSIASNNTQFVQPNQQDQ